VTQTKVVGLSIALVTARGEPRSQLFAASLLRRQTHKPSSQCTNAETNAHRKHLSWGSFKDRPSVDTNTKRPLQDKPKPVPRQKVATPSARSVLAVPPDSDGLLRSLLCRSIAPCSRPWGSPRFKIPVRKQELIPNGADPSKLFPLRLPQHVSMPHTLTLLLRPAHCVATTHQPSLNLRVLSKPESPLRTACVSTCPRSMLPWA